MKQKKQIITFVFLLCSLCLWSQNIQKHYVSKNVESGMLYFIKPMKLFQSSNNTCYFDQTIRPHNDTISIGITFTNRSAFKVDSIVVRTADTVIGKAVTHLFTEKVKNKWDCRCFIYLTRFELIKIQTEAPPILSFYGLEKTNFQLKVKPKDWKKVLEINRALYGQIKLNEQ